MPTEFEKWLDSHRRVDALFERANTAIKAAALLFGALFALLQIWNFPLFGVIEALNSKGIISFAMVFYYYAWLFAQPIEMKMSRTVYIADPERGKIPKSMFFAIPLVVGVGAVLFYVQTNEHHLAIALTIFFAVDIAFWNNVARLTRRYEAASEKLYKEYGYYPGIVQLRYYVRSYLRGSWQKYRYVTLFFLLCLIDFTAYSGAARRSLAASIHNTIPQISEAKAFDLMFGLLFFVYIAIGEGWVWAMRLRARRAILLLDDLRKNYNLSISRDRS